MKSFISIIILIVIVIGGYFLMKNNPEMPTPSEEIGDAPMNSESNGMDESINDVKEFDASASSAKWTGSKTLIKDYFDTGTIKIKSGSATFVEGILTEGEVVLDMTSITATSTGKGDGMDRLSGHLKSEDFFAVETYPEAKFVITSAAQESGNTYLLNGDLTIKGKTNPVSFPVEVSSANGSAMISGAATLDRTLWDVRFGSTKFFSDLGDNVINDEFTLEFNVVTK